MKKYSILTNYHPSRWAYYLKQKPKILVFNKFLRDDVIEMFITVDNPSTSPLNSKDMLQSIYLNLYTKEVSVQPLDIFEVYNPNFLLVNKSTFIKQAK